jgi:putative hydroxymethylpyrimidine transport system substrate-binding protein
LTSSRKTRPQAAWAALACLTCALALGACGAKQDALSAPTTKRFTVMLARSPEANDVAIYAASAHGDFRAVGLDVAPVAPAAAGEPLRQLAAGKLDMAIASEPELLLARDEGLKLVAIGALVQHSLVSIISLPSAHVAKVADLVGKTVGTTGLAYQSALLRASLQDAGVAPAKVRELDVGDGLVSAMTSGKVATTLGGYSNYEALQLRLAHRRPSVIALDQAGVPSYDELVLVVREAEAHTRGQDLRAFLQALTRGEREVRSDPSAAAALLVKANPSLEVKLQLESIEQTLPLAQPSDSSDPYGWQEPTAWATFGNWMLSHGLLVHDPNGGLPPFTNEFLPGQGI